MHRPTVQREGQATAAGVGVAEATVTAANCAVPCGFPCPGVPLAAPRVRVAPSALQKEGSREHQGQKLRPPCQCGESRVLNPRRETFGLWLRRSLWWSNTLARIVWSIWSCCWRSKICWSC